MKLGQSTSSIGLGRWRRFMARFDWPLFVVMALIAAIGLINLYSATFRIVGVEGAPDHGGKFDQQIVWMSIGVLLYLGMTVIDYRNLTRVAWLVLGLAIFTAVVVLALSKPTKGAQRWIDFRVFRVQPAELLKLGVILALAHLVHERDLIKLDTKQKLLRWGAVFVPVLLVAAQPDLGSATLIYLIILSVCYLCLSRLWPIVAVTLTSLAALPLLWEVMEVYQRNRVLAFLDPSDPTGDGWHTRQSIFAVGSGRILGKGFMEGTQSRFSWLPEQWTDFPFAVWGEEWGFVGALVLLALYSFLLFWIVNVALTARDRFGSVICVGVGAMVFWHVVVNICMVLGLAPVVGVTLPLVSYGGSSVLVFFLAFGLVSSVSLRRHGF